MKQKMHTFDPRGIVHTEQSRSFIEYWKRTHKEERAIFFLGANTLQIPALYFAKEMGLSVHLADANPAAPGLELSDNFYHIDLKDEAELARSAKKIQSDTRLDAVLTVGTDFSASVAYIAECCKLPGISYRSALNASRKDRMRQVLKEAGLPGVPFAVIKKANTASAPQIAASLRYPLVCKPIDNMGARGVRAVDSPTQLSAAIHESIAHSRSGTVILEEKISGREYSLDSLLSKGRLYPMGIARRYIDYPPYFIERGHSFPSDLSPEQEGEMFNTLAAAATALGIHNGAAKGDIFFTDKGPVIGEIAARLSGGFMSGWTFPLHSGIHPAIGAILVALGEEIPQSFFSHAPLSPVSERGIISIPGTIHSIVDIAPDIAPDTSPNALPPSRPKNQSPSAVEAPYRFISVKEGDKVSFPRNNVEKCGNIICRGSSEYAEKRVASQLLRLRAKNRGELRKILSLEYPPAYPALIHELQKMRGSGAILRLPEDNNPRMMFSIPNFVFHSTDCDWNYRTVAASLAAIQHFLPECTFHCQNLGENWGLSLHNFNMLMSLLKGGFQAALYYIELCTKNSEKKGEGMFTHELLSEVLI